MSNGSGRRMIFWKNFSPRSILLSHSTGLEGRLGSHHRLTRSATKELKLSLETETPKLQATATATSRRKVGRPRGKKSNPDYTQVTVYLRKRTHLAAKKNLLDDGREFSELVEDLLAQWVLSFDNSNV